MKSKSLLIALLLFACSCSLSRRDELTELTAVPEPTKPAFFKAVPISKFSSTQCPCLEVEIDDKSFLMELDLGFCGDVAIAENFIEQIASKEFIQSKDMYGIRGKQYSTNLYRIPKIQIGSVAFIEPLLKEDTSEFIKDSVFVENGGEPSTQEPGRLGWQLFYNVNLLIDIQNAKIAFCDSLETLKNEGYSVETFVRCPLILEQGLVEIEANTPQGPLLCMLDTGCTRNLLNTEAPNKKSIEEAIWAPENSLEHTSFHLNDQDFGAVIFQRVPMQAPFRLEAILGMEFFQNHLVFIDFANKSIYFSKNVPSTENHLD